MTAAAKFGRRAALLAFALIGVAPIPARAQVRTPTHVACVGDSITYGYLASSSSKSYPSDLQAIFGSSVMVKNFGRNSATLLSTGDLPWTTADNGAEYTSATTFVSSAGASAVVDVIIMLGTNDSKSYNWMPMTGTTRAAQFMSDYGALVDHFTNLSTHPRVFLALPAAIYTNTFGISESVTANEIDPIIRQVATQKGMPIIDIHTPTSGHPEYFQDGVHPTDAGYMILAQLMHDGLLQPAGTGGAAGGGAGGAGGGGGGAGRGGAGGSGAAGRGGAGGASGGSTGGMAGRGGAAGGAAGRGGTGGGAAGAGAAGRGAGGAGGATAGTGGSTTAGAAGTGGTTAGTAGASGGSIGGGAGATGAGGRGGTNAAGSGGTGTAGAGTGVGGSGGSGGDAGGGGCGCQVGETGSSFIPAVLLLAAFTLRRRRRGGPPARSGRPFVA
jgi:lysophospholipase L1-like esterase